MVNAILYYKANEQGREILKSLLLNIDAISAAGMDLKLAKLPEVLDEAAMNKLYGLGVTSVPAILFEKTCAIGIKNIKLAVKNFVERGNKRQTSSTTNTADIHDYMAKIAYDGITTRKCKSGKVKLRREKDDEEDDYKKDEQEISRRLNDYKRTAPKHRRAINKDDDDEELNDRIDNINSRRSSRMQDSDDEESEEIEQPRKQPAARQPRPDNINKDDLDGQMIAALMDKI